MSSVKKTNYTDTEYVIFKKINSFKYVLCTHYQKHNLYTVSWPILRKLYVILNCKKNYNYKYIKIYIQMEDINKCILIQNVL